MALCNINKVIIFKSQLEVLFGGFDFSRAAKTLVHPCKVSKVSKAFLSGCTVQILYKKS